MSMVIKGLTFYNAKKVIQTLGKRETLSIVLYIYQHNGSYLGELERCFQGRISRKTIHKRLKELHRLGILRSTNASNSKAEKKCKKVQILKYELSSEYSKLFKSLTAS